jgi:hypothetical protein
VADLGARSLEQFQDQLLFGTDLVSIGDAAQRQAQKQQCSRLTEQILTDSQANADLWSTIVWHHLYMPQQQSALCQLRRCAGDPCS